MVKTFGDFEFDDQRRALTAAGRPVRLGGQAVDLLSLLVERPGELITRDEIRRRLWPDSTVEFDHSLDVVVSRLRTVLGDRGPTPRYIATEPRRGYRFVEPVIAQTDLPRPNTAHRWVRRFAIYAAVAILAALAAILFVHARYDRFVPSERRPGSARGPISHS
jgi:DNA-binding winged helix-turn-helix (wHTH) protein